MPSGLDISLPAAAMPQAAFQSVRVFPSQDGDSRSAFRQVNIQLKSVSIRSSLVASKHAFPVFLLPLCKSHATVLRWIPPGAPQHAKHGNGTCCAARNTVPGFRAQRTCFPITVTVVCDPFASRGASTSYADRL